MIDTRRNCPALCMVFAATLLSLGAPSIGLAQDADVKAAVDASHAAIQSLNIGTIAALWSHEGDVTLVNPRDTTVALGWDAVRSGWEKSLGNLAGLEIRQAEGPHIATAGPVAWSMGIAHVVLHFKSKQTKDFNYLETDVFMKKDEHWLLVSHTAKPI